MKVFLASDHGGFRLKNRLFEYLNGRGGVELVDLGPEKLVSDDDYPDIAKKLGMAVRDEDGSVGIILCRSGVGVCVAANKIQGVRAGLAPDPWTAQSARNDDDVNVLCLAADRLTLDKAKRIVRVFLQSSFSYAKRHRRRVAKVNKLDKQRP